MLDPASRLRPLFAAGALILVAACQSGGGRAPVVAAPDATLVRSHYFGSPLGGPAPAMAASAARSTPWTLTVRTFSQAGALPQGGTPLVERASMVVDPRRSDPLLPGPTLLAQSRWYAAPGYPEPAAVGEERLAMLAGQTERLALRGKGQTRDLCLYIERPLGASRGYPLTVAVESDGETLELMHLADGWQPEQGARSLAVEIGGTWFGFTLEPWAVEANSPEVRALAAEVPAAASPEPLELPSAGESQVRFLDAAFERLRQSPDRYTLVSVASELGAGRAQDWALLCTDEDLARWTSELGRGTGRKALSDKPRRLALHLETSALAAAAHLVQENADPAARSYLVRQTGQLAYYPDVLLEILALAQDQADLTHRLRDENRIFLEDTGRAARLRAFEWLKAQGLEPHGFDPLSRSSVRQDALERWRDRLDQTGGEPDGQ
ncbi:MAG: hypothetical protein R3F17_00190 [Planctomycetota bacterium]